MLLPIVVLGALLVAVQASSAPAQSQQRCRGQVATIVGTAGADKLRGTPGRDVIVGLGGNDKIQGRGGSDVICAGSGRDRVNAGGGNDYVNAENGDDRVLGGGGRDRVDGGADNDYMAGGGGNDVLRGGPGDDRMAGGGGRDRLDGGGGFDECGPATVPGREPGGVFGPARAARGCEVEEISVRQQTVRFAGQDWSILGAVGSYEDPSTFGDPSREPRITDQRRLYVRLQIENRTTESFSGSRHQFLLELPGTPTVRSDSFFPLVSAGTAETRLLSFEVRDNARLASAVVVLGSPNLEQERLPLATQARPSRFPLAAQVDATVRSALMRQGSPRSVSVQILGGEWDLELSDTDPSGSTIDETRYRAPVGSRVLRLDVRFTSQGDGVNIVTRDMRVLIDGVPREAVVFINEILRPGTSVDDVLAFHVPAQATEVTVLVGAVGEGQIAEFPVVVPDLSR